ncbi:MAG: hypothetical protein ACLTDV_02750 [Eubacterium sp.]
MAQPWYTATSSGRTYKHTRSLIIEDLVPGLRRLVHYDYWSQDKSETVRFLLDSGAHLTLIRNGGTQHVLQIVDALDSGHGCQRSYIISTARSTRPGSGGRCIRCVSTLPSYRRSQVPARKPMPTVFISQYCNTDPFERQNGSFEPHDPTCSSCRIRRPKPLSQSAMDARCMRRPYVCGPIIRPMKKQVECSGKSRRCRSGPSRQPWSAMAVSRSWVHLTLHQGRIIIQTRWP